MSLINNMLLDLDKSNGSGQSRTIAITDGLHAAVNVPPNVAHQKRKLWPAIIGIVVLLTSIIFWSTQQYHPQMLAVITDWPALLDKAVQLSAPAEDNKIVASNTNRVTTVQSVIRSTPATVPIAEKRTAKKELKKNLAQTKIIAVETSVIKTPAKPDPIQMAAYHYAEATHQLAQQQLPLALASLRKALQLNPKHFNARSVLAQQLINLQQYQEAEQLLRTGIGMVPRQYLYSQLLAKLMISQGAHEKAITILESRLNNAQDDAGYLALLAMQYQTIQRHDSASEMFNKALKIQPQKNTWWLGLAISLEALQQLTLAKKAYLRAAAGKQLPVSLQKFTVKKIALLDKV